MNCDRCLPICSGRKSSSRTRIIFSQRRKGRKGFLRSAGLSGLSGLARDINDSRARIYFLAKARRTQRIPKECWTWRTWRETLMIKREDFCSRKGAKDAKEFLWNAGLGELGGLARDINDSRARITFSQRRGGRKGFLWNAGLGGLSGLARDFNDSRTRIYFLAKKDSNWIIDLARKITRLT